MEYTPLGELLGDPVPESTLKTKRDYRDALRDARHALRQCAAATVAARTHVAVCSAEVDLRRARAKMQREIKAMSAGTPEQQWQAQYDAATLATAPRPPRTGAEATQAHVAAIGAELVADRRHGDAQTLIARLLRQSGCEGRGTAAAEALRVQRAMDRRRGAEPVPLRERLSALVERRVWSACRRAGIGSNSNWTLTLTAGGDEACSSDVSTRQTARYGTARVVTTRVQVPLGRSAALLLHDRLGADAADTLAVVQVRRRERAGAVTVWWVVAVAKGRGSSARLVEACLLRDATNKRPRRATAPQVERALRPERRPERRPLFREYSQTKLRGRLTTLPGVV